jgi:gamma-glutamyltranspeptidase/glutathione hydrolase
MKKFLFLTGLLFLLPMPARGAFVQPTRSSQGMVVSAHPLATQAGLLMLEQGGNAVDAAVATAFAISVVEPFSAGIGGGGFLLYWDANADEMKALDFRERAPLQATRDLYRDQTGTVRQEWSLNGHLAAGVPGTVAGLYELHQRYGKLSWPAVITPAIGYASKGFAVGEWYVRSAEERKAVLLKNAAAREIFTRNGQMLQVGDILVQRDLAATLRKIAENPQDFYTGTLAQSIAEDMAKHNGIITLEDLQAYRPIWREPLCGIALQVQICSMPPPSSGGVHLLEILNIIGETDLKSLGWHHPDALHLLAESMRIAYSDRSEYLGDPDFVEVPVESLTNPEYGAFRRTQINLQQAKPSSEVKPAPVEVLQEFSNQSFKPERFVSQLSTPQPPEYGDTTHLSVVDQDRNAISLTFTVNGRFGAGVVVENTGILLNNEMNDFAIAPDVPNLFGLVGNEANAIAPGKTPLSSMTPTIVLENDQVRLVAGSPGGSTIITTVLQLLLNVLVYEMDAGEAVSAPRIHHQWLPDELRVEQWGLDVATQDILRQRGHQISIQPAWGNANLILVKPNNILEGAADPRGEGAALGY